MAAIISQNYGRFYAQSATIIKEMRLRSSSIVDIILTLAGSKIVTHWRRISPCNVLVLSGSTFVCEMLNIPIDITLLTIFFQDFVLTFDIDKVCVIIYWIFSPPNSVLRRRRNKRVGVPNNLRSYLASNFLLCERMSRCFVSIWSNIIFSCRYSCVIRWKTV